MNINLLRKIDRYIGISIIFVMSLFRSKRVPPRTVKRILIIKLFGWGNFVFLSPSVKNLHTLFPQAAIDVLTFQPNKAMCSLYADQFATIHALRFSLFGMLVDIPRFVLKHMRSYDIIIDYEQFVRLSTLIGLFCFPKFLMGLSTKNSKKARAYDVNIHFAEKRHIAEESYETVISLAQLYHKKNIATALRLTKPIVKDTPKTLQIYKQYKSSFLIGVCAGGRWFDTRKRYPQPSMSKVVDLLLKKHSSIVFLFVGSPDERDQTEDIISRVDDKSRCVNLCGQLSLAESGAIMARCALFISNDTGPLHLAAALGLYCVGLYGPTPEDVYGPYTDRKLILRIRKRPVMVKDDESIVDWPKTWWPKPEDVSAKISVVIQQLS